jgi:hypothetical protein
MYTPVIAEQLRDRGHDVDAVLEHDDLIGLPDSDQFATAQHHERTFVTEDVSDYMPLHVQYSSAGQPHHGLVFTTNAKFPRGAPGAIGALVIALDAMIADPPSLEPADGWVYWL